VGRLPESFDQLHALAIKVEQAERIPITRRAFKIASTPRVTGRAGVPCVLAAKGVQAAVVDRAKFIIRPTEAR
jgi:hypothetical protein